MDDALGVVAVDGIPGMSSSRSHLLPMAAQLAQLDHSQQSKIERPDVQYSVGWSRGRERFDGQEPDWNKGSFYANPLCDNPSERAAPMINNHDAAISNSTAAQEKLSGQRQ